MEDTSCKNCQVFQENEKTFGFRITINKKMHKHL